MRRRAFSSVLVLVAGLCGSALSATPQDAKEKLDRLQHDIEKSRELRDRMAEQADAARIEIDAITQELLTRTRAIRSLEDETRALQRSIREAEDDLSRREADLDARRKDMAKTLAALQRLSDRPAETVLLQPGEAIDTVRSAELLATTVPEIKRRAKRLRDDIVAINRLRRDLKEQKTVLSAKRAHIQSQQSDLEELLESRRKRREALLQRTRKEDRRIAEMAREANSLRDLIERLEREPKPPANSAALPANGLFAKARGRLPAPVRGRLVGRFGAKTASGHIRGVRVRTSQAATVIAPFDGRVVYAGPYRSYGQILIIAHGQGYHSLLAGLSRIDAVVGQGVLAGEPVGVTGRSVLPHEGAGNDADELYIEIRKDGVPIDPTPWFKAEDLKG